MPREWNHNRRIRGRDVVLPDWTRNPPSYANLLRDLRPVLLHSGATVEAAEAVHRANYDAIVEFTSKLPELRRAGHKAFH